MSTQGKVVFLGLVGFSLLFIDLVMHQPWLLHTGRALMIISGGVAAGYLFHEPMHSIQSRRMIIAAGGYLGFLALGVFAAAIWTVPESVGQILELILLLWLMIIIALTIRTPEKNKILIVPLLLGASTLAFLLGRMLSG